MNYKKLSHRLEKLEQDFYLTIQDFRNDAIFQKNGNLYLKEDKKELKKKWKKIAGLFRYLKFIMSSVGFSLIFKRNYDHFAIKHYCTVLYYNMTLQLQETFQEHEDFIRQFLDETYKENYSTVARYIYRAKFLYYLNYPKEFLSLIKKNVHPDLQWLLEKQVNYEIKFEFEYKNFYYYFKWRIDKILRILVKYSGLFLAKIKLKFSQKGLISPECLNEFYKHIQPGDILLSRENFVATNISIPGFWKHMSMYLGTGEYLKRNFSNEIFKTLDKNTHYIIESTGKGVCIESVEDFAYKLDYLGVFRTTFSPQKINNAIILTTNMLKRNYDYLFNYYSDECLVCSELITKAYLKDSLSHEGLSIELKKIASGLTYPPNDFIQKARKEKDSSEKEIYPVLFIDTNIRQQKSFINTNDELLKSDTRSRFSFLLQ